LTVWQGFEVLAVLLVEDVADVGSGQPEVVLLLG
jgi:hypothetical protein